jgi:hypothetical protein
MVNHIRTKAGNIWVGSDSGLDLYNESTNSFEHQPTNGKNSKVSWIDEDSKGQLWLGFQSIVALFKPGYGIVTTFREQRSCFYEDTKGSIGWPRVIMELFCWTIKTSLYNITMNETVCPTTRHSRYWKTISDICGLVLPTA